MITEDYVSFETAKLLKEKGFNEYCPESYFKMDKTLKKSGFSEWEKVNEIKAPTQSLAMKWLRKNHQIFIRPNTSFLYPIKWYSEIFCYGDNLKTQQDIKTEYYDSPEEACEAAIKYCLEKLI